MKYLTWLVLLLIAESTAAQKNPFFPLRRGLSWEMHAKTGKGKPSGKFVNTVDRYDSIRGGFTGNIKSIPFDKSGKQKAKTDIAVRGSNDTLFVDMRLYYQLYDNLSYKWRTEPGMLVWPPVLSEGQILPDGLITFTAIKAPRLAVQVVAAPKDQVGKQATYKLSERKVEGVETIKTTAGTFECFKVSSKGVFRSEIDGGSTLHYRVIEWVAKGAGIVKTEIYKNDKLITVTQRENK